MKIFKKEIRGIGSSKKERILFATSKEELEILSGIAEKSIVLFPKISATSKVHERLRNIVTNFKKAFKNWDVIKEEPAIETYQDAINIVNRAIRSIDDQKLLNNEASDKKKYYVELYDLLRTSRDENKITKE